MTLIDKLEHLEKEFLNKERDNTSGIMTLIPSITANGIMTLIASATANGVSKAIDIVKEHKCIWKGVYSYHQESTCYALSCGNEYFDNYMGDDIKYCPYCGGEIEFSEV